MPPVKVDPAKVTRRGIMSIRTCLLLGAFITVPHAGIVSTAADSQKAASVAVRLASCELPEVAETARCGVLDVPENPNKPNGRRLQIAVAVIPATGKAQPDPIVPLMGGPGEETIGAAAYFIEQFAALRNDRDILLVDQRGTGRSGTLRCDLYSADDPPASLRDVFPLAVVNRCQQQLSAR